jgi:hypothetical protein
MLTTAFSRYINNYRGFTKEIWFLRWLLLSIAPAPWFCHFIQVFKEDLNLSYAEVGWIMVVLDPC